MRAQSTALLAVVLIVLLVVAALLLAVAWFRGTTRRAGGGIPGAGSADSTDDDDSDEAAPAQQTTAYPADAAQAQQTTAYSADAAQAPKMSWVRDTLADFVQQHSQESTSDFVHGFVTRTRDNRNMTKQILTNSDSVKHLQRAITRMSDYGDADNPGLAMYMNKTILDEALSLVGYCTPDRSETQYGLFTTIVHNCLSERYGIDDSMINFINDNIIDGMILLSKLKPTIFKTRFIRKYDHDIQFGFVPYDPIVIDLKRLRATLNGVSDVSIKHFNELISCIRKSVDSALFLILLITDSDVSGRLYSMYSVLLHKMDTLGDLRLRGITNKDVFYSDKDIKVLDYINNIKCFTYPLTPGLEEVILVPFD